MTLLGRESMALIAATRHAEGMTADDKARIRRKLAQRLGSGIAAGAAIATNATVAQATNTPLLSTLAAWLPAAAKLTVALAVSGTIGAIGVDTVLRQRDGERAVKTTPAATHLGAPAPREVSRPEAPVNVAATEPSVAVPAPAKPSAQLPAKSTNGTDGNRLVPSAEDTLGRQVAAIREARAALRRGDASSALAALDYSAIEGQGPLEQEALVARVSALCLMGDVHAARQVADKFILRFGDSLLVPQIRATCAFETNPSR